MKKLGLITSKAAEFCTSLEDVHRLRYVPRMKVHLDLIWQAGCRPLALLEVSWLGQLCLVRHTSL
jgi:hypothetical protein